MALTETKTKDIFEAYIHEDTMYCETNDYLGGISDILYCYQPFIEYLVVPSPIATNTNAGTITSIICKKNKGFKSIKPLIETAFLKHNFSDAGNAPDTTELTAFLLGTRAQLIGFSRKMRDRPFTFIVKDNNGKMFLTGTLQSPAYLRDFSIDTAKKFDDDCGAEMKFRSNTLFYEFTGTIPIESTIFGDFDEDFSNDFD